MENLTLIFNKKVRKFALFYKSGYSKQLPGYSSTLKIRQLPGYPGNGYSALDTLPNMNQIKNQVNPKI